MWGGTQRAFCQSRHRASKDKKMLLMHTMEDSSLPMIYDCRFSIVDLRSAPALWRLTNVLFKRVERGADP